MPVTGARAADGAGVLGAQRLAVCAGRRSPSTLQPIMAHFLVDGCDEGCRFLLRKKPKRINHLGFVLAEREGFEPSIREYRIPDFESGAFDHSAISPDRARLEGGAGWSAQQRSGSIADQG